MRLPMVANAFLKSSATARQSSSMRLAAAGLSRVFPVLRLLRERIGRQHIEWLDQFVDTRAKRRHLLYLIALSVHGTFASKRSICFSAFACCSYLIIPHIRAAEGAADFTDRVSRIILDTISGAFFTKAITILLKELYPFEVVINCCFCSSSRL